MDSLAILVQHKQVRAAPHVSICTGLCKPSLSPSLLVAVDISNGEDAASDGIVETQRACVDECFGCEALWLERPERGRALHKAQEQRELAETHRDG